MSHQDTEQSAKKMKINPPVFYISALVILLIVGFAALFPQTADIHLKALQTSLFKNASWFYILAVALILLSVTFMGLSRFGDIKLGPDHARPAYSYIS